MEVMMPITLSEFLNAEKKIEVEFRGEKIEVFFLVNALNTEFIETYYGKTWHETHPGENRLDSQLAALIKGWNLVDDDGNEIPVSLEVVAMLPLALKKELGEAIWRSVEEPDAEEKKG
jgi:hypothetical protein